MKEKSNVMESTRSSFNKSELKNIMNSKEDNSTTIDAKLKISCKKFISIFSGLNYEERLEAEYTLENLSTYVLMKVELNDIVKRYKKLFNKLKKPLSCTQFDKVICQHLKEELEIKEFYQYMVKHQLIQEVVDDSDEDYNLFGPIVIKKYVKLPPY